MEIIIIILIAVIIFIVIKNNKGKKKQNTNNNIPSEAPEEINIYNTEKIPYRRKYLLTKNELYFYKNLKIIANEYGYNVLSKIRVADLIEVSKEADEKEYLKYFNKISSKHIDFALCNPDNLYIEYLIELDDGSHNEQKRKDRDEFIEKALEKSGYSLLRVYTAEQVKNKIINKNSISENINTTPLA